MQPWEPLAVIAADALDDASSNIGLGDLDTDDATTDRILVEIRRFRSAPHSESEHRDLAAKALTVGLKACELLTYASRVGSFIESSGPSPSAAGALIGRRCLDAARRALRAAIAHEDGSPAYDEVTRLSGESFEGALARMKHLDNLAREADR